jgi:hypothetical protein
MKAFLAIAVLIILGIATSGCGGGYGSSSNPQNGGLLAGKWTFTYVSTQGGGSATVSGTLTQTGSNFSGTVTITGSCTTSGMITGTINGYAFTATITETGPETISVTGTVATGGGSSAGTYQVTSATGACAAASGDSGTWSGTLTPGTGGGGGGGPYIGIVRPADRMPVQLGLNFKNDGSQLSGTATFTNSACLHSMNVSGKQTGLNLELHGDAGNDGSIELSGTTDNEGKTLTLHSMVSGACQAESGIGILSRMQ